MDCTDFCRRSSGPKVLTSAMSTWWIGRGATALRIMAFGTGCGSGFSILPVFGGSFGAENAFRIRRRLLLLVDMSHAVGAYLVDVFFVRLDWWVIPGFIAQGLFTMRFLVQWIASER